MKRKLLILIILISAIIILVQGLSFNAYDQVPKGSFDTLYYKLHRRGDFRLIKNGGIEAWLINNPQVYEEKMVTNLKMRGWAGPPSEIDTFGYIIDDGDFVEGDFNAPYDNPQDEAAILLHGGEHAKRYAIEVPIANLSVGEHTIKTMVKTVDDTIYHIKSFSFEISDQKTVLYTHIDWFRENHDNGNQVPEVIGNSPTLEGKNLKAKDYIFRSSELTRISSSLGIGF